MHPNIAALDAALAQARTATVREFLGFMRRIQPVDRLPPRAAFDPAALAPLLANVVLVEVVRDGPGQSPRFFVRVAGQTVLDASDQIKMNSYLDETLGTPAQAAPIDARSAAAASGCAQFWRGPPRIRFKLDYLDTIELAHCPLAEDGSTVDRIVSIIDYGLDPLR
ncbi:MAG: hypothetical protein ING44_11300 [Telmatospirillum sp.]|nr:hypothetical protein [Telmatospirillum sp.]